MSRENPALVREGHRNRTKCTKCDESIIIRGSQNLQRARSQQGQAICASIKTHWLPFCTGKCKFLIGMLVQNVLPVCLKLGCLRFGSVPVYKIEIGFSASTKTHWLLVCITFPKE
jgi:hypothetical protein